MSTTITQESPDTADATRLVMELETHLASRYPSESRHGYSVEKLISQGVAFFVLRSDGAAAACGGVQLVGTPGEGEFYGELKRMYVRPEFRGLGFGKAMLDHLAGHIGSHACGLLRLETGVHQQEAIGLYESFGFRRIPPFGPYTDDPLSLCFEKRL